MDKKLFGSAPLFLVTDLHASVDYYCEVLGFERPTLWGEPPFFAMPKREQFIIMLQQRGEKELRHNEGLWDAYFWVADARSLFEEFQQKGAEVVYEPEYRDSYGNLEFAVRDPDGYTLAFAQEMTEDRFYAEQKDEPKQAVSFLYLSPVLASEDVARDVAWYEDKLGFRNVFDSTAYQEGPMDYAVIGRQGKYLHLQMQFPEDMTSSDIKFEVKGVMALYEEFALKKALPPSFKPRKTPWGTLEFSFFDPSKNRLTFLEDL